MKWLFTVMLVLSIFSSSVLMNGQTNYTTLDAGYYQVHTIVVNTTEVISYSWNSTGLLAVMAMNNTQLQQFLNGSNRYFEGLTIITSSYHNELLLSPGTYYLVFYAFMEQVSFDYSVKLMPAQVSYVLPPGYREYYFLNLSYPFHLTLDLISNQSFSIKLYNENKTILENKSTSDVPLTYINETLTLPQGNYSILVDNPDSSPMAVYSMITYSSAYPNPLSFNRTVYPMGIASYGLYNRSGVPVPYSIKASSVIGFANITSILAYNSTARELNVSPYSASLQLNVPLLLFNGRENQTYWAQNVVTFITNESALCFESSILNVTNKNSTLTNFTVQGRGGVYPPFNNGFYYIYKTRSFHYSTPLSFLLSINVSIVKKLGVKLTFNVRGMQNGSLLNSSWDTYDSVLILDPAVTQAYLYVNGNSSPPYLNFYDAELVFGGGGNGATAYFENLSAYLSLFYFNGSLHPFPSVYSIGGDTAETASNAHVTLVGGYAYVSKGEDDPELLTNEYNSSIPIIVKIVPSHQSNTTKLQNTTTTNVTNTTKVTNTTRTSPVSTQNQTPTTQIPPTPSHQSSFSLPLVLGIAGVVIVVIIVFLVNRFRKPDLNI